MKIIDRARLVQSLQDTSLLVACKIGPGTHALAAQELQRSITLLLGELNKDWRDLIPQDAGQPSVGVPD